MDTTKKWIALSITSALLILVAGWLLLVSPERQEAADLRDEALVAQAANAQQETRIEVLRVKAAKLPDKRAEIADIAARIPGEPALPDLVRGLTAAARSAGVELVSVAPGVPVAVAAVPNAAPADPGTPDPAAPADPAAGSGLSSIPVTMTVSGEFFAVEDFVARLEDLPRAFRLTALGLAPGEKPTDQPAVSAAATGRSLTTTLTGQVYVSGAAAAALAAPAGTSVGAGGAPAASGASTAGAAPDAAPVN